MSGFALTHRSVFDHPLFEGDASRLGAWLWLCGKACWKPTPFNVNGKIVTLERGQVCASVRQLAEHWGWSKSAVDRFLSRLETETMIAREAGHGRLVITLCNYGKYQDFNDGARDSSGTPTGTAAGQQRDIKEQGNKGTTVEGEAKASPVVENDDAGDGDDDGEQPVVPIVPVTEQMQQIVEVWNAVALPLGLPRCFSLSDKRKRALRARLKQYGLDDMRRAMLATPRSAFLRGEEGNWRGASFDFFLRPDSILRTLEGQYDDRDKPARDTRDGFLRSVHNELGLGSGAGTA